MAWCQVAFNLPAERVGLAEAVLEGAGAESITWAEPPGVAAVLEPAPGETRLWQAVQVVGLFPETTDTAAVHQALAQALGAAPVDWTITTLADTQWEREWLAHFQPQRFGERLWVIPHGMDAPDPSAVNVRLDPGLAFGTGTHPSTALCLEALANAELTGETVIDYGCGSGLLAIAALHLGAAHVIAVDNDPQALLAAQDNAQRNGVADRLEVVDSDAKLPMADRVLANILAGVLQTLAPWLIACLRPGAVLTLAGVLDHQAAAVQSAYAQHCQFGPGAQRDEWVRIDAIRREL